MIDSFYYKACRVIINDYENVVSREIINNTVKRATPSEFSNYALARCVINAYNNSVAPIVNLCDENKYQMSRKPGQFFFFDSSNIRVDKNKIQNRLDVVFKKINFRWLNIKFEAVRPQLKKIFFKYSS